MPSAWDTGIIANLKKTVNSRKILDVARKAAVDILVGFPAGEMHVPTIHKNENGEYKTINGKDVEDLEPIETAELAKMLHYGTSTIPARPFIEDGIRENQDKLAKALQDEAKKAVNGGQANWAKVGTMAVGAIDEFVRGDYYRNAVPNSPDTIRYKGSDKPLIDGANMIQSLHFIVQDGGN